MDDYIGELVHHHLEESILAATIVWILDDEQEEENTRNFLSSFSYSVTEKEGTKSHPNNRFPENPLRSTVLRYDVRPHDNLTASVFPKYMVQLFQPSEPDLEHNTQINCCGPFKHKSFNMCVVCHLWPFRDSAVRLRPKGSNTCSLHVFKYG